MITSLKFTYLFTDNEDVVIPRGDEQQWKKVKNLTLLLYTLHGRRTRAEVGLVTTIEIGERTPIGIEISGAMGAS